MKKVACLSYGIAILFFLFAFSGTAQADEPEFELAWSIPAGSVTWLATTGNTERAIAYHDEVVYVASRGDGAFVRILDAGNGTLIGQLDASSLTGGAVAFNALSVSDDDQVFASNLTTNAETSPFKVYTWDFLGFVEEVITWNAPGFYRMGDNISVTGSVSDGTAVIYASVGTTPDNAIPFVYRWVMESDGSGGFQFESEPEEFELPNTSAWGTPAHVAPKGPGAASGFWAGGRSLDFTRSFTESNNTTGFGNFPSGGNGLGNLAIDLKSYEGAQYLFFIKGNNRIYVNEVGPAGGVFTNRSGINLAVSEVIGTGGSATLGDLAVKDFGDGSFRVFAMVTNAGVFAYDITLVEVEPAIVEVAGQAGWRMMSSPVIGATVADIAGQNQVQGFAGLVDFYEGAVSSGIETAPPNLFLGYNGENWTPANALTNELESGSGFIWYMYNNDLGVSVPLPFNLTLEGDSPSENVSVALHETGNGFNLVGNPFRGSLDLTGLAGWAVGGNLASGIAQVWENTEPVAGEHQGVWRQFGFGANDGEIVASWQGFMVENDDATGLDIDAEARTTGGTFLKETVPAIKRLALTLDGVNSEAGIRTRDRAALVFSNQADEGWDLLDASQLTPLANSFATLSFVGERNGETILKSQESRPADFEGTFELPASLGTQNMSGDMTITWEGLADLPTEWQFSLVDHETGASVDMRSASSYEFRIDGTVGKRQLEAEISMPEIAPLAIAGEKQPRFTVIVSSEPVSAETPSDLPHELELAQNYPNPFNPSTVISYSLPEQTHVRLTVYDMLGRSVGVLVDEQQAPGQHKVTWDASTLSSGVYIYRIDAGGLSITRKMTLVK